MDFCHENGASAATLTPNSRTFYGTESNKSHADDSLKTTVPQPPDADRRILEIALARRAAGYCTLPVAPTFPGEEYPARGKDGQILYNPDGSIKRKFTGKNPSWVDSAGIPHTIAHKRYQDKQPTVAELQKWFANPINGIGKMGGFKNLHCIDFDRKDFPSQDECDAAFIATMERPEMAGAGGEKTPGGGYHVPIELESAPGFTNFCVTPGGHHAGELLGPGRFFVTAPTLGPDGKFYETIQTGEPPLITDLAAIGIYKYQKEKPEKAKPEKAQSTPRPTPQGFGATAAPIDLERLVTDKTRLAIAGDDWKGDRSETLTAAANDIQGWFNWGQLNNVTISGDPESLFYVVGRALGLDDDRIERIIKTIDRGAAQPSCVMAGGDEPAWKRVRKLEPAYKPAKAAKTPKPKPFQDDEHQPGFSSTPATGLIHTAYELVGDELVQIDTRISDHLVAVAHTKNVDGGVGLYLEFQNLRGNRDNLTMPRSMVGDPGLAITELAHNGFWFNYDHKRLLVKYIVEMGRGLEDSYTIASKAGWIEVDGVPSFVLHGETIGDDSIRYLDVEPPPNPLLQRAGDLQSWQRTIGAMAEGNSRLIFAVGMGLAPTLLKILDIESGGIILYGPSSTGKTTALNVVQSVTGERALSTFNATANGTEAAAEAHSDLTLLLDEMGQGDPRGLANTIYMLGNEGGKTRMSKSLAARESKHWRLFYLGTGEIPLIDHLRSAGMSTKGGVEARGPSVPADAGRGLGAFDTIHQSVNARQFADELKHQSPLNRGCVLVAFLDRLVPIANSPEWVDRQRARHQANVNKLIGTTLDPDGTVGRVARRFALIQLALELAQSWQVTLFPEGQVEWAIERLFTDWIDARGGAGSIDIRQACDRIEALFVTQEFGDRIRHVTGDRVDQIVRNLLATKIGNDFLVPPSVFDSEIVKDADRKILIAELQKRGWLAAGDKGHHTKLRRIPGEVKSPRVFVFTRFWAEGEAVTQEVAQAVTEAVTDQNPYAAKIPAPENPVTAVTATPSGYNQAVTPETYTQQQLQPPCNRVTAVTAKKEALGKEREKNKTELPIVDLADDHVDIDPDDFDWSVTGVAA